MMTHPARAWFEENASRFSGPLSFDEPLSRSTYYRIGGPASIFAIPRTTEDLQWLADGIRQTGVPYFVLGLGSNLLVSDSGFSGLVIKASRLNLDITPLQQVRDGETFRLRTGASVAISTLLRHAATEGWGDLEFLSGVPGSIGGVVRMNAGTHLGEAKDRIRRVEAFSLTDALEGRESLMCYEGAALRFHYRKNLFLPQGAIVLSADWECRKQPAYQVKIKIDETLARRKATQPVEYPSCGSVFKNPKEIGVSAWEVIDKLGLRGHRIGNAQFAEKHSNFIINLGGATADDVRQLIELAKRRAREELSVTLEEEVMFLGF